MAAEGVTNVAMESTGVFWKPIFNILESRFTVLLMNARHLKQVPGRKSDIRDCQWIAQSLQCGLLKGSFIPPRSLRELRDLTRHQTQLVEEKTLAVSSVVARWAKQNAGVCVRRTTQFSCQTITRAALQVATCVATFGRPTEWNSKPEISCLPTQGRRRPSLTSPTCPQPMAETRIQCSVNQKGVWTRNRPQPDINPDPHVPQAKSRYKNGRVF
jgi:Transposase